MTRTRTRTAQTRVRIRWPTRACCAARRQAAWKASPAARRRARAAEATPCASPACGSTCCIPTGCRCGGHPRAVYGTFGSAMHQKRGLGCSIAWAGPIGLQVLDPRHQRGAAPRCHQLSNSRARSSATLAMDPDCFCVVRRTVFSTNSRACARCIMSAPIVSEAVSHRRRPARRRSSAWPSTRASARAATRARGGVRGATRTPC